MEKVILTQISIEEFRQIIREEIELALQDTTLSKVVKQIQVPEIMDINDAVKFLSLSRNTIYGLTSKAKIPRYKKGGKLYFKRSELTEWVNEGRQKTIREMVKEAESYASARHKKSKG